MIYLRARYYQSLTGRFTTRDTYEGDINTPASLNLFNYAHSNPVMNTDPSGNCIFAGVDTILCAALTGGVVGGLVGGTIGGAYAEWMYHLAYTGKCGCEGQQLISQYTESQFVWKGVGMGAAFGAVFGALSATGTGGVAISALAGMGLSGVGITSSIQRLQTDPNNECAWWDLGLSIFGFAVSGYTLGNAVSNLGLPGGAAASQGALANGNPVNTGSTKEVILGLWDPRSTFQKTWIELLMRGRRVFSAGEWKRENLSTVEASRQNFPQAFTEAMTNAKKINFDITRLDINRAWREGSSLPSGNNYTNYEFYQIMTNPKWLAKTTFYKWENGILRGFSATEIEIFYPMLP